MFELIEKPGTARAVPLTVIESGTPTLKVPGVVEAPKFRTFEAPVQVKFELAPRIPELLKST
jgi:hypothetical protein